MKNIIYIITLFSLCTFAQNKYLTKTGIIEFEASVPSFEAVEAKNKAVTAIINGDNGEFAALALIKGFRFKNALMEEHFNENYAESDIYPKAKFKGNIIDFSIDSLTKESTSFFIHGELEFHGKTKTLKDIALDITFDNDVIKITGEFLVNASGFDIKIPKIVSNKIANDIKVSFEFELKKK